MEETETIHPDYLKGFNEGYTIGKHLPELSERLDVQLGDSMRSAGFKDGKQQVILEQKKNRMPGWLRSDRLSSLDKPADPSKEKDHDDLDRHD